RMAYVVDAPALIEQMPSARPRPIHLKRLESLHAKGAMTPRQVERFAFAIESMSLASVAAWASIPRTMPR
ncbi:MAG: hypothetical protein ABJD07_13840, partial [Gemmatimonadaceae bacterium]